MQHRFPNWMASRTDRQHRLSPRLFVRPWRVSIVIAVFVFGVGSTCSCAIAVQRGDQSHREFVAPTPQQLFRHLSSYQPIQERQTELDQSQLSELEKSGREFLSKLSPEQQDRAWKFAKNLMQKNGVDSPEFKAVMSQFGVPDELQEKLAEQFKESQKSGNRESIEDMLRRAKARAGRPISQQERRSIDQRKIKDLEKKGRDLLSDLSPEQKKQAWEFAEKYLRENGVDTDSSKALMNQFGVPPELQKTLAQKFKDRQTSDDEDAFKDVMRQARELALQAPNQPKNRSKGEQNGVDPVLENPIGSDTNKRDLANRAQPTSDDSNRTESNPTQPTRAQPNRTASNDNSSNETPASGRNRNLSNNSRTGSRNGLTNQDSNQTDDLDPFRRFRSPDADTPSSDPRRPGSDQSNKNVRGPELEWEETFRELARHADALGPGDESAAGAGRQNSSPDERQLDAETQAKLMDAVKEFATQNPSSADKNRLSNVGKTLSRSNKDSSEPKERLTARFDRLLVDAAKRSLNAKSGLGPDFEIPESVDSTIGDFLDKFHESGTSKNGASSDRSAVARSTQDWQSRNNNRRSSSNPADRSRPSVDDPSTQTPNVFGRSDQPNETTVGAGDGVNLLKSFSEMPKLDPKHAFTVVAVVGLVLFVAYLMMRKLADDETTVTTRKFGRKFRNAKIKSPSDLVEAVDHFLVNKFGSDSRWWNAKHALNILHADAPDCRAKISELIKDYVRARYMRAEVVLSESEQQRYKATLQELSKLAAKPARATATGMEG